MYKSKNPRLNLSEELVQQIEQVTDFQIDELILLVAHRFNQLHPDREGFFLTVSTDPVRRQEELHYIIRDLLSVKGL